MTTPLLWEEEICFDAKLILLPDILAWTRIQIAKAEFVSPERERFELALEEAIVNILSYAYKHDKGSLDMTASFYGSGLLVFILKDYGLPFDPLTYEKKDGLLTEGGHGISLIKHSVDEVSYTREGSCNILKLAKRH